MPPRYFANRLKKRRHADLELVARETVERNVAVLFGEDIGKARGEAMIIEPPIEQGEGQRQGVVAAGLAEGRQGRVIAGYEIAGLEARGKAKGQILLVAATEPDSGIGIGGDLRLLAVEAQLQLEQAGG